MIRKTTAIMTIASGLILLSAMLPARADFIPIAVPDAAYVASTTLLGIGGVPDDTILTSLSDGAQTVSFDIGLAVETVPTTWGTWGSPPNTESATPRVLWTNGLTSLQMDLTAPAFTFGFEAQPNISFVETLKATFFSAGTLIGTITLDVDGNAGARLFAATTSTDPFDSVTIFGLVDFAIANVRYGTVAAAAPEPGPTALLLLALGSMLLMHGRRRGHISTRTAFPAR